MKQFRAAVIGAGFMGSMHAAIFDSLRGVAVVAVVDSDEAQARRVAGTLREARAYPTLEAAFAAGPPDFVSVCTRDHLHREPVLLAAAHGAHVLVEKPIASTVEDAHAMRQACERAGVQIGVGYLLRFDPRYAQAKALLDAGRLGEPIHLYARRNSPRSEGPKRYGGELSLPLHVTVHDADLVLWLLAGSRPVSVYAQTVAKLLGPTGTQDSVLAVVRFDDGTLVSFESSWALPAGAATKLDARLEIVGTAGMLEVTCGESGLYLAEEAASEFVDTQHWPNVLGQVAGDLRAELTAFVDGLTDGRPRLATAAEAIASLELTLAIMRSAETGEVLRLD